MSILPGAWYHLKIMTLEGQDGGENRICAKIWNEQEKEPAEWSICLLYTSVVEIADGTYFLENTIEFTPEDSGSDECTIYYKAAEGANPVISGGRLIEGDWQEEGGGIYSICLLYTSRCV